MEPLRAPGKVRAAGYGRRKPAAAVHRRTQGVRVRAVEPAKTGATGEKAEGGAEKVIRLSGMIVREAMELKIRFRCYYCDRTHTVDASAAGKKGRCPCGKLMIVPELPGPAAPSGEDDGDLQVALPPPPEEESGLSAGDLSRLQRQAGGALAHARGGGAALIAGGVTEIVLAAPPLVAGLGLLLRDTEIVRNLAAIPSAALLGLPGQLWITLLFALAGILLLDGIGRIGRGTRGP